MEEKPAVSPMVTLTLLAASCMVVMCGTAVTAALPAIRAHFEGGDGAANVDLLAKLVLTTPSLAVAAGAPLVGVILDARGRKAVLVVSLLAASLVGASGFFMDSLPAIIAIRAGHGLALAGIMTSATALAADYFSGPQRVKFMGLQSGFMGYGAVAFLFLGGVLADVEWRMPFLMYLSGLVVVPAAIGCLRDPEMIGRRVNAPRMAPGTWATVGLISAVAFISMVAFMALPVQLPFHLEQLTGASGTQSGVALAFCSVLAATTSMFYGRFRARMGHSAIALFSFMVTGIGLLLIGIAGGLGLIYAGLVASAVGTGLVLPNVNVWVTAVAPQECRGRALGVITTFMFLGQFVSPVVFQPVADRWGLAATLSAAGAALLIATVVGLPLLRLDRAPAPAPGNGK